MALTVPKEATLNNNDSETKSSSTGVGNAQTLSTSVIKRLSTQWHLPPGWENCGFQIRGNGMVIECPFCRAQGITWRPEKDVEPWQKKKSRNGAHGSGTRAGKKTQGTGKAAKNQVNLGGWGKNEAARIEESIRRMRKRSDPMGKKILQGLLRRKREQAKDAAVKAALKGMKKKPSPPQHGKYPLSPERREKQKLYQERHNAKQKGLPVPPLPKEAEAA